MKLFKVNDSYEFVETKKKERILWINEKYTHCYTIELEINRLKLHLREIDKLNEIFDSEKLFFVFNEPNQKYLNSVDLSESEKRIQEKAWEIIKTIASRDNEPDIFNEGTRSEYVKKVIKELGISKATVYKYLRKFWQGGKLKVSLMPEFYKCGGRGKEKKLGIKKVGRKNFIAYVQPDKQGINISDEFKEMFKHYIKKYHRNPKETSLSQVYRIMKSEEFTEVYINEEGEAEVKTLPSEKIPTFYQFKYWYYKKRDIDAEIAERKGEKEYLLNHTQLPSNAKYHAVGPGYIFEIDSTIYPVYLLNRIKGGNIGRPVVYHVSDVFTTMIAGIYIGTHSACYEGAISAIYNCTEDKVEFCKRYGIDISDDDWPTTYLCNSLRADRGELVGKLPEKIISNLGITIETTASFMGKMKGTVEGSFNLIQSNLKPYLHGVIEHDFRKRGGSDARKEANMTMDEFTRHVINAVILHNRRVMKNYYYTQSMLDDNVKPIPNEIWKWGILNISGNQREISDTYLKLNLMREAIATVTEKGIEFLEAVYRCDVGEAEKWFSKARNTGRWKVNIRFDPRDLTVIYIVDENRDGFIYCHLAKEYSIYRDRTFEEIKSYLDSKKEMLLHLRDYENQCYLDFHNNEKNIIQNTEEVCFTDKKVLTEDIKENRRIENEMHGKEKAIKIESKQDERINEVVEQNKRTNVNINLFNRIKNARKEENDVD